MPPPRNSCNSYLPIRAGSSMQDLVYQPEVNAPIRWPLSLVSGNVNSKWIIELSAADGEDASRPKRYSRWMYSHAAIPTFYPGHRPPTTLSQTGSQCDAAV